MFVCTLRHGADFLHEKTPRIENRLVMMESIEHSTSLVHLCEFYTLLFILWSFNFTLEVKQIDGFVTESEVTEEVNL